MVQGLFGDHYVDVKVLYVSEFRKVPAVAFIGELDITAAFTYLRERLGTETKRLLQHSFYDHAEQKMFFNNSIFILDNYRMIEVAGNYCQVLHAGNDYDWAADILKNLAQFRMHSLTAEGPATVIGFARQTTLN